MKNLIGTLRFRAAALAALLLATSALMAQVDHEVIEDSYGDGADAQIYTLQSPAELEDLVGPIALYPDDLVSIVLPAATYPVQVVQAARFLQDREGNPDLQPPDDWDDAVVALLNYPEVIEMMNDDLDWTWALGDAFLNQQQDVLTAVSKFRDEAYAAGNLKSDEHQVVRRSERVIEIEPVDPEVIYVPYYEPERVIVYQPYPVYYYHPYPRYSYYYPYPANYGFSYGYFFGVSTAYRLHWVNYSLYTYNYGYRGHPYYGRGYHDRFYYRHRHFPRHRPRLARSHGGYVNRGHHGDRWKPRKRHGARPLTRTDERSRNGIRAGTHRQDQLAQSRRGRSNATATGSKFAAGDRSQRGQARQAFSDKNPDQRRLVRRYREDARNDATQSRRQTSGKSHTRLAGTTTNNAASTRNSRANNVRRTRPDNQTRTSQRNRSVTGENSRDVTLRSSPRQQHRVTRTPRTRVANAQPQRSTVRVPRQRVQQRLPNAGSTQRQARPASRPRVTTQGATRSATRRSTEVQTQRRPAARQSRKASPPARQARPAATPRPAHQAQKARPARQARAEERRAPARAKQRGNSSRRSEPRRR